MGRKRKRVDGPLQLNLGCGQWALKDFDNRDRVLGTEIYPLPDYADESAETVRASHVLEHFPHGEIGNVIQEWVRVLKPGGWLKIAVPDFDFIARRYIAGADENIQGYAMGGQSDADDFHKTLFDKSSLTEVLHGAGLVDVQRWKSELPDCASLAVSLNLMARKPVPVPQMRIGCAMSTPRLGFQDNFFAWAAALMPFNIVPVRFEGCFWGQCLERTMTQLVDKFDWILTLDYDSLFTREQVGALLRLAHEHPEADAIAPMQMARGRNGAKPLLVIRQDDGTVKTRLSLDEFSDPLLKVETAHFGMTMIRCDKLRAMPHPWFLGSPNAEGTWGEGRIDDDIHFWHKWRDAGNTAYIANRVVLGHLELMATWPDKELNPIYQYPSDFHEKGAPLEIWE